MFHILRNKAEVSELRPIEDAYVPILKMRVNGIEIDMTFAKLNAREVPTEVSELDEFDPRTILQMDGKCIRSLNGYR